MESKLVDVEKYVNIFFHEPIMNAHHENAILKQKIQLLESRIESYKIVTRNLTIEKNDLKDDLANTRDELANTRDELVNTRDELANITQHSIYRLYTLFHPITSLFRSQ
jgi:chromosome segregation ATPase